MVLFSDHNSGAIFSDDRQYRYRLWRRWAHGSRVLFVMLNPSTADEVSNDPTIERCVRRMREYMATPEESLMGAGCVEVVNIFALRSTYPRALYSHGDPVGSVFNDSAILAGANDADVIVCGWGKHGAYLGRGAAVERLLRSLGRPLYTLGLNADGSPKHPLYIGYAQPLNEWNGAKC